METVDMLSIGMQTLVGTGGQEFPYKRGNCFSMHNDEGEGYRIVNFNVENLKELIKRGLTWPIKVHPISKRHAILHDERIPHEWYDDRFCSICCPESLLPLPQRAAKFRDREYGVEVVKDVGDGMRIISLHPEKAHERNMAFDPSLPPYEEHQKALSEAFNERMRKAGYTVV